MPCMAVSSVHNGEYYSTSNLTWKQIIKTNLFFFNLHPIKSNYTQGVSMSAQFIILGLYFIRLVFNFTQKVIL